MEDNNERKYPTSTAKRNFLTSLLNEVFVFLLATLAYFAIFYNVQNSSLKQDREIREQNYDIGMKIAKDSGLYHESDKGVQWSSSDYYDYFIASFLYYDYKSEVYDYEKDPDGFKEYEEYFKNNVLLLTIHDGYVDDGYIGHFYSKFVIGRVNSSDSPLVSYSAGEGISHYVVSVLKSNDNTSGGKYFDYKTDTSVPHLKSDVRTLLFNYVFKEIKTEEGSALDSSFNDYFLSIYNTAGNLLMEDKEYSIARSNYETSDKKIISLEINSVVLSLAISILIIFGIVPLFNINRRNPAQYITSLVMMGKGYRIGGWQYFGQILAAILKYFHIVIFLSFFSEMRILTESILYVGSFGINLFIFAGASAFLVLVSIILSAFSQGHRNLDCFISSGCLCIISRSSENNIPSDTASE